MKIQKLVPVNVWGDVCLINTKVWFDMQNNGSYPNFGRFSQTLGVNAKILGFYTLGTHFSWGYPNFVDLPKMCYLDVV